MLIGAGMTANVTPDSIVDRIADIEDNVGDSYLTVPEQIALFLATTCGTNANAYWLNQIGTQGSWDSYFSANAGQNYLNTLQWTVAAMNGALAGYGATPAGLIEPTVDMVTNKMVSALAGALTVTAGKLLFNWIPRIVKPLALNINNVINLGNNGGNPKGAEFTKSDSDEKCCPVSPIDGTIVHPNVTYDLRCTV